MNFRRGAASLVALALFSVSALAQSSDSEPAPVENAASVQLPDDILALLNDKRTAQELSDDDLKARAKAARKALKDESVAADVRDQLKALMESDRAELETRSTPKEDVASPKVEAPPVQEATPKAEEQPVQEAAPKAEEQPVQEAAPEEKIKPKLKKKTVQEVAPEPEILAEPKAEVAAELPADVIEILNDQRDLAEMSGDELAARAKKARQLAGDESLPKKVRRQLSDIAKASKQTLVKRDAQPTPEVEPPQQEATPTPKAVEPKLDAAVEPVVEPPADVKIVEPVVEPPSDVKIVEPVAPATPVIDKVDVQELDANKGDPESEKKAQAFLDDATPADSLKDDDLRARLDAIRDLMAENELSVKTERALRKKLSTERDILRERLAKAKALEEIKAAEVAAKKQSEADAAAPSAGTDEAKTDKKKKKKFNIDLNILITPDTPRRTVLLDRRPSEELEESELRQRIKIYRDVEADDAYDSFEQEERDYWRETMKRDRQRLRRDLEISRQEREDELNDKKNVYRFEIDDEQDYASNDYDSQDVFAAEVDDADIERVLVAPPRKKPTKRYTLEDIEAKPQVRNSLSSIEVDTIRFGFNEAFVREEEVDSLDKIASVIERVLKKYPREVFLIEGHTDAVGSDAYNAKLSKGRAEAVKKALTSFYIIPAKNLKTVGLGERYLKIPTADAEQENRRVSISRATALIGEADE